MTARADRWIGLAEVRTAARRRLPRPVFDFVDGGAEDEVTVHRNRADFADVVFRPTALQDVRARDQSTTVLGVGVSTPVLLAPCGLATLAHRGGESAAARAAHAAGTAFALSTASGHSMERVAAASDGPRWFQLYVWQNREATLRLVERAAAAGYGTLCLTIDVPLSGQRERDLRHGMSIPPRPRPRAVPSFAVHPAWTWRALVQDPITFGNFVADRGERGVVALGKYVNAQMNPGTSWADLEWLRSVWDGSLVVKGVMRGEDARRAAELGAEGVVVSNHGGRQLDGLGSTIAVLPEVVAAVGGAAEVFLDGGVRRGSDVVKAVALGAQACLVGRPWVFGLAAAGEAGVTRVLEILRGEIDRTLALLGVPDLAAVTPASVEVRHPDR